MKFGMIPVVQSTGAVLAHGLKTVSLSLKKGEIITPEIVTRLLAVGVAEIMGAQFEQGDVDENEAAGQLAARLQGTHLKLDSARTGRCNLLAEKAGVFFADKAVIDRVNAITESITLATLSPMARVAVDEIVATVKIIPFAVPQNELASCLAAVTKPLAVLPFQALRIGVISTLLPGLKAVTIAKTLGVLNARLAPTGNVILHQKNVAHDREALAQAIEEFADGHDLLIIFGASAITDRRDIIPAAVEAAGGRVEHFGMPVDPGNLLLIGEKAQGAGLCRIIGAPGCARSPKENGFDLVLQRVLAGLRVSSQDIRGMGVGGLLKEIKTRPFPRGFNGEVE